MKGIYMITIKDKIYIGKDSNIDKKVRLNAHRSLLRRNKHYNTHMQSVYNKYNLSDRDILYEELYLFEGNCSKEELDLKEISFIDKYKAQTEGYNQSKGGDGGLDVNGSRNPMSKISEGEFNQIVSMLIQGASNEEIAKKFNLHSRYVSLIRHKKRHSEWWSKHTHYEPIKSDNQKRSLSPEQFIEVVRKIKEGESNAQIERDFLLSSGTVSRIRNKKTYNSWWEKYINPYEK